MLPFLCFVGAVAVAESALAPFILPCKLSDGACLISSAQAMVPTLAAGIPSLDTPALDPMFLDLVNGDGGGLELTFKNTTVLGMKDCQVENLKIDETKGRQHLVVRCSVDLTGQYRLGGRLLVLPISGEGNYDIRIRDIVIKCHSDVVSVPGEDGKLHWHIARWRHSFDVKTNTHFNFENLFNGNKILADPVLQFANTNWRDVMQEIAPSIVRTIVARVVDAVEALYKAVPAEELALNDV